MTAARVFGAANGDTVRIRVVGRGTFASGQGLRDYAAGRAREGATRFLFDLAECPGMDSTFVGILAMLATQSRGGTVVQLAGASPGVRSAIEGLGIADLFEFLDTVPAQPEAGGPEGELPAQGDEAAVRETMLRAHETLITAQPANEPTFRHVLDVLREDNAST